MDWVSARIPNALKQPKQNEQNNKTASNREPNRWWGFLRRRRRGVLRKTNPDIQVIQPARWDCRLSGNIEQFHLPDHML